MCTRRIFRSRKKLPVMASLDQCGAFLIFLVSRCFHSFKCQKEEKGKLLFTSHKKQSKVASVKKVSLFIAKGNIFIKVGLKIFVNLSIPKCFIPLCQICRHLTNKEKDLATCVAVWQLVGRC